MGAPLTPRRSGLGHRTYALALLLAIAWKAPSEDDVPEWPQHTWAPADPIACPPGDGALADLTNRSTPADAVCTHLRTGELRSTATAARTASEPRAQPMRSDDRRTISILVGSPEKAPDRSTVTKAASGTTRRMRASASSRTPSVIRRGVMLGLKPCVRVAEGNTPSSRSVPCVNHECADPA